jgi:subtilisin family serine protease
MCRSRVSTMLPTTMSQSLLALMCLSLLTACSRRAPVSTEPSRPAPTEAPAVVRPPVAVTAPAPAPAPAPVPADSAAADWHRLDYERDGVMGVGSERALRELLGGRQASRRVVVAVIDGGVDTAHTMLAPNIWRNPRETAANGKDDDGNGLIDDTFGWSLVTDRSGAAVQYDTYEITRLYAACRGLPAGTGLVRPPDSSCAKYASSYESKKQEVTSIRGQIAGISNVLGQVTTMLSSALGNKPLTRANVTAYAPTTPTLTQARQLWLQLEQQGITAEEIEKGKKAYDAQYTYGLDTTFSPRQAGTPAGAPARGSRDVTGPDASHGTHVAGIIGATRVAGQSVQGIAPSVSLMVLRAVPDGDERDPDVAAAIRYAVDHGAQIINMSFGKEFSPNKAEVDAAAKYAESKGVLLVHAAGNDGKSLETEPSFPTPILPDGSVISTWIEVGASSWKGADELAANFSNYGKTRVDLFAPGADILSTMPGGTVARESGTSMAAPVVAGVAALLMSYFPELTAADVKRLLVESVRKLPNLEVALPGGDGSTRVKFDTLSRSGGVLDAYAAVKLALSRRSGA